MHTTGSASDSSTGLCLKDPQNGIIQQVQVRQIWRPFLWSDEDSEIGCTLLLLISCSSDVIGVKESCRKVHGWSPKCCWATAGSTTGARMLLTYSHCLHLV